MKLFKNGLWIYLLPVLALAYIDPSVSALLIMFVGPILVLATFIAKKAKFVDIHSRQGIFKAVKMFLAAASIFLSTAILIMGIKINSPEEVFKRVIIEPIPSSVKNIESEGRLFAMGASSLHLKFDISPSDFSNIIASSKFSSYSRHLPADRFGRGPQLYEAAINEGRSHIGDIGEVYLREHRGSSYRFDILLVNETRTKVYYKAK